MKKNIEYNVSGIKCDNSKCDYINEEVSYLDYPAWVNKPCPKCSENLLTEEDYFKVKMMVEMMESLNLIDLPFDSDPQVEMSVDVHNETFEIKKIEEPYAKKKTKKSRRAKD